MQSLKNTINTIKRVLPAASYMLTPYKPSTQIQSKTDALGNAKTYFLSCAEKFKTYVQKSPEKSIVVDLKLRTKQDWVKNLVEKAGQIHPEEKGGIPGTYTARYEFEREIPAHFGAVVTVVWDGEYAQKIIGEDKLNTKRETYEAFDFCSRNTGYVGSRPEAIILGEDGKPNGKTQGDELVKLMGLDPVGITNPEEYKIKAKVGGKEIECVVRTWIAITAMEHMFKGVVEKIVIAIPQKGVLRVMIGYGTSREYGTEYLNEILGESLWRQVANEMYWQYVIEKKKINESDVLKKMSWNMGALVTDQGEVNQMTEVEKAFEAHVKNRTVLTLMSVIRLMWETDKKS
ncbi:hypothetical protein [Coleofasciculus sp.]|uniref:hypothetical protein n=1 Tax=Coleofasciculus sp. TaxID=3100458 RepID=UPI0039F8DDE2